MGNPLPIPSEACPWANFCWTASIFVYPPVAPLYMTITIGGVAKGDEWDEGDDPPPSGNYCLEQTSNRDWMFAGGDVKIRARYSESETTHHVWTNTPFGLHKYEGFAGPCAKTTQNAHQSPVGQKWYGGTMSVIGVS